MNRDQLVVDKINEAVRGAVEDIYDFRGERTLFVPLNRIKKVCQLLFEDDDLKYNFLSDICVDDLLPEFPRFAVNYHLYSLPHNHRLRLRVLVEDPDKGPPTMSSIWPIATWLEMEVWDLMGIQFKGNGGLRRLFLPEDWQGHPLRKDYPLGYEEVQFSFNWQEINKKKPFAKD